MNLRWATNIASSQTLWQPMGMFTGFSESARPNYSHLAYANGHVFVQTNRGAVAGVDLYNGMIDWLATYNRGQQATNPGFNPMMLRQQGEMQNQTKPWTFNPVIVSQGLVFTLPLEGRNLLILDATSGKRFKEIDLDDLGQRIRSDSDISSRLGLTLWSASRATCSCWRGQQVGRRDELENVQQPSGTTTGRCCSGKKDMPRSFAAGRSSARTISIWRRAGADVHRQSQRMDAPEKRLPYPLIRSWG